MYDTGIAVEEQASQDSADHVEEDVADDLQNRANVAISSEHDG